VRDAVTALLDEPTHRAGAVRLQAQIEAMPSASEVIGAIEARFL
jgi:hypothetical protein